MEILKDRVDELVRTAAAEAAAETALSTTTGHVRNLMRTAGMGATQAMDAMGVPEAMRSEVATLLGDDGD